MSERNTQLAKTLLYYASKSSEKTDQIMLCADLITAAFNEDPFATANQVKQKVCTSLEKDFKLKPHNIRQIYIAAQDVVLPFLASGQKIAQADAQLDKIAQEAAKNLYQAVYDKQGNMIDEVFSPATASAATSAIKTKMDILLRTQKNVLDAQKQAADQRREEKELNLGQANREQLQNFLKQKLMNNPELAIEMIKKKEEQAKTNNKDFYKGE